MDSSTILNIYMTDEAMEELEDRNPTTNIVGYVDAIMAPSPAGATKDILFKFILSNDRKRIPIFIWNPLLINKYYKEICSSRVVDINGGFCRAVNRTLKDDLIPYEIVIKENTQLFLGYHSLSGVKTNEVQKSTFDTIHALQGLIEISGHIRTKFYLNHNRSGQISYGLGAITNGVKKITIQVKQFVESQLELGDFVTVTGTVQGQESENISSS
ncbi:uncharacterized protein LOC116416159 isoform X2 [Nasonia vitripennis]|uniref:Uncharacterized protein n=1 Tax=Nasonia vitripennis TaxID=7425 RepID=A0A7M7Q3F4_NASVI|nr:uncharacterized protein LOC116416159 isoform X2 [Nasonia vitripennis]